VKSTDIYALATAKTVIKAMLEQRCEQEIQELILQMFHYTNYPASNSQLWFILQSTKEDFFEVLCNMFEITFLEMLKAF